MITGVSDEEIRRSSDGSRKGLNNTNLSRNEFERVWARLRETGSVEHKSHRFALALLCQAFPDLVQFTGGATVVVRRQDIFATDVAGSRYAEVEASVQRWPQYRDYYEGLEHWSTKNYIAEYTERALASLRGAPWGPVQLEVAFKVPTRDRVDVLLYDCNGLPVVIEVKPEIGPTNDDYYAQAAKYRAIWQVLSGVPPEWVRCVLAAPRVTEDDRLRIRMMEVYNIETVEVDVPDWYKEEKRPEWEREMSMSTSGEDSRSG